jgi:hypothetical protein
MEASRRRKLSQNEDSVIKLAERIEKIEKDRYDYIRQLSREIDTIKGKNEELQSQLAASQAATHEILLRFEDIQQKLMSLTSLDISNGSQSDAEDTNVPVQDKQLAWWKRLLSRTKKQDQGNKLTWLKVWAFIVAYVIIEMSTSIMAGMVTNRWPQYTEIVLLIAVVGFSWCLYILAGYRLGPLKELFDSLHTGDSKK